MESNCSPKTRKYPFENMKIDDNTILNHMEGRSPCMKCCKSRKFFCYTCYLPVENLQKKLPKVKLPVKIDIIKHKNEIDGKSTSAHAPILAPDDVRIFQYPDIPDYSNESGTILIFPGAKSVDIRSLFDENHKTEIRSELVHEKGYNMGSLLKMRLHNVELESGETNCVNGCGDTTYNLNNLPVKRAVFIDSTWNQSRGIYKDEKINSIKTVVLQNRLSQFWRHQRGSPRWYLATIEAIHQFLLELHVNAFGLSKHYRGLDNLELCEEFYRQTRLVDCQDDQITAPYNGQYDNLLFFFSHMYNLIHFYYDHNELVAYRRPI